MCRLTANRKQSLSKRPKVQAAIGRLLTLHPTKTLKFCTLQRGRLKMGQMVRKFLENENRAQRVLIETSVAIMAIGLVVAVMAIFLMK